MNNKISAPMLEIQSLSVYYESLAALENVSLNLTAGEILAIVGPNGSGKTSLIKSASGSLAFQGRVMIKGKELTSLSIKERARCLAVVPQARQLPLEFSVQHTVMIGRTPYLNWLGQPSAKDFQRAQWAMERTSVAKLADHLLAELSGGELQRVLLARALAQEPQLLLLDEPTTHLDLKSQSDLLNLLKSMAKEKNLAVMMALHDLNLAGIYADRIALLANGRIRSLGTPDEVLVSNQLAEAFGLPIQVVKHPDYGTPLVLPDGRSIPESSSAFSRGERRE